MQRSTGYQSPRPGLTGPSPRKHGGENCDPILVIMTATLWAERAPRMGPNSMEAMGCFADDCLSNRQVQIRRDIGWSATVEPMGANWKTLHRANVNSNAPPNQMQRRVLIVIDGFRRFSGGSFLLLCGRPAATTSRLIKLFALRFVFVVAFALPFIGACIFVFSFWPSGCGSPGGFSVL